MRPGSENVDYQESMEVARKLSEEFMRNNGNLWPGILLAVAMNLAAAAFFLGKVSDEGIDDFSENVFKSTVKGKLEVARKAENSELLKMPPMGSA